MAYCLYSKAPFRHAAPRRRPRACIGPSIRRVRSRQHFLTDRERKVPPSSLRGSIARSNEQCTAAAAASRSSRFLLLAAAAVYLISFVY